MNDVSSALWGVRVACGTLEERVFYNVNVEVALQDTIKALQGLASSLQPQPPKPKATNGHTLKMSVTEQALEIVESAWDPDSARTRITSSRCKALLLEVVMRAIRDWILYRSHTEITKATHARDAYEWLFLEDEDHPSFRERTRMGYTLTSFVVICEINDLEPDELRRHIRTLKVSDIMGTGRPAERRRRPNENINIDHHDLAGVRIEAFEPSPNYKYTYLEQHYAPNQSDYI
jgi:hypothetical protein